MKNFARLIAMNGGLESLASRPIALAIPGNEWLYIDDGGPSPLGDGTRLVSVAFLGEHGADDLSVRAELFFGVGTGGDRKTGWRSGTWRPVKFTSERPEYDFSFVRVHHGKPHIHAGLWGEWRSEIRRWNREIVSFGLISAFEQELAAEREMLDRVESERCRRSASERAAAQTRPRDDRGRFLRTA